MTYASENRDWLEPYVLDLADRLNLSHWKIDLVDDEPDDGCMAQVWMREDLRWASILVGEREHDDPEKVRDSVVHELLHIHLTDLDAVVRTLETHVVPAVYDVVERQQRHELERAIASLTRVVAAHLPLPPESETTEDA